MPRCHQPVPSTSSTSGREVCSERAPLFPGFLAPRLTLAVLVALTVSPLTTAAATAQAAENPSPGLYFRTDDADRFLVAPTLKTDVRMTISGMIARVRLRQHFRNPTTAWLEGVYVFPLPERSAVDRLRLHVGERLIEGSIMEKVAAKAAYRKAAAAGRKASLVSGQRPNIFTTSAANIGPGETVVVDIEYQDTVRYEAGRFTYRFPMVVAPRYIPGTPVATPESATGWAPNTDQVPDAAAITPPVRHPSEGPVNPVTLSIDLLPGFALDDIASTHHPVSIQEGGDGRYIVTLRDGNVPADRDFVLAWTPVPGAAPRAALFTEQAEEATYLYGVILPPTAGAPPDHGLARDLIFIIDVSGSMAGDSIEQAKQALLLALAGLGPRDRFNIVAFNSRSWSMHPTAWPASPGNLRRAQEFVNRLRANGGTEMRSALIRGLHDDGVAGRLRQVVFLTDGAVGNEDALFRILHDRLGDSRLFTVGIGSAPNTHFMRKAAEIGRGTFTYVGRSDEVAARMIPLLRKLARPALKDIALDWPAGMAAETFPTMLPDLYFNEPLVFSVRLTGPERRPFAGMLTLGGRFGSTRWQDRYGLAGAPESPGVAAVWARAKLTQIMDGLHQGRDPAAVREAALAVALSHRLVSRYTSLIVVDRTISRPAAEPLDRRPIATNLPQGWVYDKVFGPVATLHRTSTLPLPSVELPQLTPIVLPRTATPARLHIMIGVAVTLIAMMLALLAWRRWATGRADA